MLREIAPRSGDLYAWVGLPGQPDSSSAWIRVDSLDARGQLQTTLLDAFSNVTGLSAIPLADFVAAVDLGYLERLERIAVSKLQTGDQVRLGIYRSTGQRWAIEVVHSVEAAAQDNVLRIYFVDSDPIDFDDPDAGVFLHRRRPG